MALGFQSAADVDRHGAVAPAFSGVDEVDRAAGVAESQIVVVDEFGGGEAVVEFDEVEFVGPDTGLLVGGGGGLARQGVDIGEHLAGLLPRVAGQD